MRDGWRAEAHTQAAIAAQTPGSPPDVEAEIDDLVASCYADPLRFVETMYPWGEPDGPLADETGPDDNQRELGVSESV